MQSRGGAPEAHSWSTVCGVSSPNNFAAMNAAANCNVYAMTPIGSGTTVAAGWADCQLVPAAFTVQIMFPSSVGTAAGIARIGRLKTLPDLRDNTRTWAVFGDQFTAYSAPRLCSGGKLALRGVKVSAIPYNMNHLSEFTPVEVFGPTNFTWDGSSSLEPAGFAPVVIVNDLLTGDPPLFGSLELLVTIEWRVRFDPANPAMAAHTQHAPATDSMWHRCISTLESAGHGAEDIVESVADAGVEAAGAAVVGALAM
jgi:hypothetical protein